MTNPVLVGQTNLERLRDVLDEGPRVVTLRGPGGVGKTTLARATTADDTIFVELDVCRTTEDVAAAIGEALGLPETLRRPDPVAEALPAERIVLDNAEHVVADVAGLLDEWLEQTAATFLLTSRERLGLDDEVVFEVAPLMLEDARTLFELRARRVVRGFEIDASNREDVDLLLEDVDGLPLAIELAAARVGILTPDQIRQRLEERYDLLREREPARPGRPSRHWTLDACVGWSWDLLDDTERQLLETCAIFRGRFSLEDVEQIADLGSAWAGDVLEALVEKSLVQVDRTAGIRFALYDAVRRFAERSATRDLDTIRRYVELLREKNRAGRVGHADLANVVHAFELAITDLPRLAVDLVTEARPRLIRGGFQHHLSDMIAHSLQQDHLSDVQRARLTHTEATIHYARMDYAGCEARLDQAWELVEGLDEPGARQVRTEVALMRGIRANESHDTERAARILEEAIAGLDSLPIERRAHVLSAAGLAAMRRRDLDEAVALMDRALNYATQSPDVALQARTLSWSALVEQARGNLADATRRLEQSLELFADANDVASEAQARTALAISWVSRDRERALELARRAQEVARKSGLRVLQTTLAVLIARLADPDDAIDTMRRALREFTPDSRHTDRWVIQTAIAVHFARKGQLESAIREVERMLETVRRLDLDSQVEVAGSYLAVLHALNTDLERVREVAPDEAFADVVVASARRERVSSEAIERWADPCRDLWYDYVPAPLVLLDELLRRRGTRVRLVVREEGERVEVGGAEIDLSTRYVLRRLFAALCDALEQRPGEPLTLEDLLAAGWPDEEMTYQSGIRRVYSAIRNLRKLGLEDVLLTAEDGYLLDSHLVLVREP